MRILLACPYAWDVAGGVQAHVRDLAVALDRRGHQVVVVTPGHARSAADPMVRIVGRPIDVPWSGGAVSICPSRRSYRRIKEVLDGLQPDVVHAHEPFAPSTSMLATLAARAPVVATFHAFCERARTLRASAPLLRIVDRRIAASLAVSVAAAELARRVARGPIEIVPNGVRVGRFARSRGDTSRIPSGRVLLWVSRLEPRKGFPTAVRAFAELAVDLPDVRLVVVGDGRDRHALRALPRRLRSRVVLLGHVPDAMLPRCYAAADVFLAPSLGPESFGIVLAEAMAAGLPIVASDIRGYRDVVRHGVEGLLVPPADPRALAAAVRRVLNEPALATSLARAGRQRARQYSWDVVVPRLEAVYESVARGAPSAARPAVSAA